MNVKIGNILASLIKVNNKLVKSLKLDNKLVYLLPDSLLTLINTIPTLGSFIVKYPSTITLLLLKPELANTLLLHEGLAAMFLENPSLLELFLNYSNNRILLEETITSEKIYNNTLYYLLDNGIKNWETFLYLGIGTGIATIGLVYNDTNKTGYILGRDGELFFILTSLNGERINIDQLYIFVKRQEDTIYYSFNYNEWYEMFDVIENVSANNISTGRTSDFFGNTSLANVFPYYSILFINDNIILDANRTDSISLAENNKIILDKLYEAGIGLNDTVFTLEEAELITTFNTSLKNTEELTLFPEISKFKNIETIDVSGTNLSGDLELSTCISLKEINFDYTDLNIDLTNSTIEKLTLGWPTKLKLINCANLRSENISLIPYNLEEIDIENLGSADSFTFVTSIYEKLREVDTTPGSITLNTNIDWSILLEEIQCYSNSSGEMYWQLLDDCNGAASINPRTGLITIDLSKIVSEVKLRISILGYDRTNDEFGKIEGALINMGSMSGTWSKITNVDLSEELEAELDLLENDCSELKEMLIANPLMIYSLFDNLAASSYFTLTGNSNIFDTGYSLTPESRIEVKLMYKNITGTGYPTFYGQRGASTRDTSCWYLFRNNNDNNIYLRNSGDVDVADFTLGTIYTISNTINKFILNGTERTLTHLNGYVMNPAYTCSVPAIHASNTSFEGRLYYFKIYDNNVLLKYLIPFADNKMLDLCSNTIISNTGTSKQAIYVNTGDSL